MTDAERDRYLLQIVSDISEIKVKVSNDYAAIYGNGKPGLIEDVKNLTQRLAVLETQENNHKNSHGVLAATIAWLVNAAIAVYAAMKNG